MNTKVKILVIDDSAYNRRTIIKILEELPGLQVVGYAGNGEEGLRKVFDLQPDLITLDLEMPRMDGFSFLRILMKSRPTPVIVISSRAGSGDVFKALDYGAVDFVAKPAVQISPKLLGIRNDLLRKIRGVAGANMAKVLGREGAGRSPGLQPPLPPAKGDSQVRQLVIGASTGGPPALQSLLASLPVDLPAGVAICQHMPAGFTRAFAERLDRMTDFEVLEAKNGDLMRPGRVLIAPGGMNLALHRRGEEVVAFVDKPAVDQRYVPSVDVLFRSASDIYSDRLLGVVLTGMGNDGSRGTQLIKERGGCVLAENESSSVVFGMPKEAIATGCVDGVFALEEMGPAVLQRLAC